MAATPLRRWLRRQPQPVKLRVDGRDVAVATGANQWAVTEETILSLSPSRIEAIDGNGVVLRCMTLGERDDEPAEETRGGESEMVTIARLIAEAHDAGARRHAEAYALAFTENTRLVQVLASRLSGLETAWQKAMQQTAQAQANMMMAQAAAEQSQNEDPAGAAIVGMLGHMVAAKTGANGVPDGAKKGAK